MAFDVTTESGILCATFKGCFDSNDLAHLDETLSRIEAEYKVTPHRITDFSASEGVQLSCAAVEEFADKRRRAALKNAVKSAIVVSRPLQYGIARMFEAINDNPRIHIRIFTNRDLALNWIAPDKIAAAVPPGQ